MNIFMKVWAAYLKKPHSLWQLYTYSKKKPVRLVVGSCYSLYNGWIHSDIETLDILKTGDWDRYFVPGSIDIILAEHVWEHLTPQQGEEGFANCFKYLRPGGFLRVAVPDGYHASEEYIGWVKPGGTGYGADDHKVLYNYRLMSEILEKVGFEVKPLEYFDEEKVFHREDWNPAQGMVKRSARFDSRNQGGKLVYTSLIVDAFKPLA